MQPSRGIGKDWAGFVGVVTDGYDGIEVVIDVLGERLAGLAGDVDANLLHSRDG